MGSMSLMHWLVVLAIILVLFGAGKLPRVMGDFAKGIKAFKSGMKEEDETAATTPPAQVTPGGSAYDPAAATGGRRRPVATGGSVIRVQAGRPFATAWNEAFSSTRSACDVSPVTGLCIRCAQSRMNAEVR